MTDQAPVPPTFIPMIEYPEVYGLTEKTREKRKTEQLEDSKPLLVNPAQVGAVLPRESYTTLIIQGLYVHVVHSYEETRELLGITG